MSCYKQKPHCRDSKDRKQCKEIENEKNNNIQTLWEQVAEEFEIPLVWPAKSNINKRVIDE